MDEVVFKDWKDCGPDQILADLNQALTSVWEASGFLQPPTLAQIPFKQFRYLQLQTLKTTAGVMTLASYVEQHNLVTAQGGRPLRIAVVEGEYMVVRSESQARRFGWAR